MKIERPDASGAAGPAGDAALLERDAELAEIARACGVAADGDGACLLISAPAGLGKTELIDRARSAADARGMVTLRAGGAELEREFAFGVVRQLFEGPLARLSEDERETVLSGAAAGAVPILRGGAGDAGAPPADGFAALHSLYWLALGLADRGPLALLVDDAHVADLPSLRFLAFLARRLEGHAMLLAVASRPQPPRAASAALEELRASPSAAVLTPDPLAPASVAGFLADALGRRPEPEFAEACHGATGGNPFLLGELAKTIVSEGMEPADANASMVARLGPASVSRAVLARLASMGPETVALARALAVLGRRSELRDAAALAHLEEGAASAAADRLVDAGVLERGRPIEFVHSIVRHAIYEDIGPGERAEAHARAARLLDEREAEPERVATHLLACEPAGERWAYERLVEVADRALAQGAPPITIEFMRRALAESPPKAERAGLLARLGSVEVRAGRRAGIPRLRDAHRAETDSRRRADIARELGGALIFTGHATEAARVLVDAIEEIESKDEPDLELAARLESLLLAAGVVTSGGHQIAQGRYAKIEGRIGALPERAARLVSAPLALERVTCGGTAPLGVHLARRALGDGRLIAEEGPESPLLFVAVAALLWSDHGAEAQEAINAATGRIEASGSARGLALTLPSRALVRLRCGALAEAEADARIALELGGEAGGWLIFQMIGASVLANVLLERGDLREAAEVLDAIDRVPRDPDAVLTQPLREAQARLLLARGDPERALGVLQACQERERSWRIRSVVPIPWRSHAASARLALGEPAEALRLADEELRLARLFDAPRPIGVALRTLGLVEGGERGLECLAEAAEVLAGSSDRLERARTLVELGAATRRAGQKSEARGPLGEGLDEARACGATALAERAYEELRATGARPRKMLYTGVDALTPSERRVASMAAEGMSNREIAQALFVTPKTVEVHLSHCYRKLEISSRRELPRALGDATGG